MTKFETGDVVLLRFPFTDLQSKKKRPALVINPPEFSERYGDVVVLPLTGRTQGEDLRLVKWREAGLLKPTWLKPLIATLSTGLIYKRLGVLVPDDDSKVKCALSKFIDNRYVQSE